MFQLQKVIIISKATHILRKVGKVVGYTILGILLLFVLVWGALQIPQVQTFAVKKVTQNLSAKLNTTIRIRRVDINFFKTIVLEGIYLEDQKQDTLLYANELRVNLGVLSLLNKTIHVNDIALEQALININRTAKDSTYNFAFIPEAFASTDTTVQDTTASAWGFDLSEVNLQKVRFVMDDQYEGNELNMALNSFILDVKTLGLEEKFPQINDITIDGLNLAFAQPQPEADTLAEIAAETAKLDTLAGAVDKVVKGDTLENHAAQKEDSVITPFNASGYRLVINDFNIRNTNIKYDVKGAPQAAKGMDFSHMDIQDLLLEIADVKVGANDFALDINNFTFQEKSGFNLQAFALNFQADMPAIQADLQKFQTPNSVLNNGLVVRIASINDVDNFLHNLHINAKFNQDSLGMKDLAYFTNALDTLPALAGQHLFLDGGLQLDGTSAKINNLRAAINKANYFTLNGKADNIDNLPEMRVDLGIQPLQISPDFVEGFVPAGTLPAEFKKMGNIQLRTNLVGMLRNMRGDINLQTAVGRANMDFRAGTDTSFNNNWVDANLTLDQLDLEKLLGRASKMGKVSLTAKVDGRRSGEVIDVNSAIVNVKSLRYNQYTYQNIRLNASYLNEVARGKLVSGDRNLQASIVAIADLGKKQPGFNVRADILEVDLNALNFTEDTLTIRTGLIADIKGTDPNQMVGDAIISNLVVQMPTKAISMDSLILAVNNSPEFKDISLRSDILSAKVNGRFSFEELPLALDLFVQKYITTYEVGPEQLKNSQSVHFEAVVAANPNLIEGMVEGLNIPQPININGNFNSATSQLLLYGNVPQLIFNEQIVNNFLLDVRTDASKLYLDARAESVKVSDSLIIPSPRINTILNEDDLQFNLRLASEDAESRMNLNGRFQIKKDTFLLDFDPSDIYMKKKRWVLSETGQVVYAPEYLQVNDFMLRQDNQVIAANSRDLGDGRSALHLSLANISIQEALELAGQQDLGLSGIIYGEADVSDIFGAPVLETLVQVDTLKVEESAIGHVSLEADRNAEGGIGLEALIKGQSNDINMAGSYLPAQETDNLSLDVNINQITLEQFNTFVKDFITEMRGNLTADIKVRGSVSDPSVNGELVFDSTMIRPTMLGVPFAIINQRIAFQEKGVALDNFTFTDEQKRPAVLNGNIDYSDLENVRMDLTFKTDRFQFVNTRTGETFYGQAFASTNLRIQGPLSNLVMTGRVKTLEDTKLFLVGYNKGAAEVERASYITFVGTDDLNAPNDAEQGDEDETQEQKESSQTPSTFSMDIRAEVAPETEVNILLSDASKDNIRALGNGDFNVRMTPQGDLLVFGDYVIEDGSYLLDLLGTVQKKFDIRKGSTITLNGPPDQAQLNITAVYEVETTLEGLGIEDRGIVQVLIEITGGLEGLDINFDLDVPASEESNYVLNDQLNQIRQNESELNKQAFALIALNKFLDESNPLGGGSGGGTVQTVNEQVDKSISGLLSNQLNNLAQDYLGVEVAVNVESREGTSSYTDKNVGLNVSKSLFNDRLSVSVGGNIGVGGTSSTANSARNVIGDFLAEYKLLPSGNLNLRFFRTNQMDQLGGMAFRERLGFSIIHRKRFNKWKYLFKSRTKERKRLDLEGNPDEQ